MHKTQPELQPLAASAVAPPPAWRVYAVNGAAAALAAGWLVLVSLTLTPEVDDFKQYWQAAVNLWATGDPFVAPAGQATRFEGFYYLPLFAYLVQPVALLDQLQGQALWYWLNVLALLGWVWLCITVSGSRTARHYWGVVLLGFCLAPPLRLTLQLGQISLLTALLLVGGFALAARRPALAGLLLALAGLFRIYPALLALYYLLRRGARVVGWCALWGLLLVGGSLVVYGVGPYRSFVQIMLVDNKFYPFAAEHNISWFGFFSRLLAPSRFTAAPLAELLWAIAPLTWLGTLAVLGLGLWAGRGATAGLAAQLQFGLWLCAMLLLSSTNGYYTLVLLLFPLLVVLRYLEAAPDQTVRNLLILATALICIPPGWTGWDARFYLLTHTGWGLLLLTPALYGLLAYLGLLALLARRLKVRP